ncbi:MAG: TIGR03087 family PEP-CTERM/XrtA system glycosyltransferase [Planctomycetes bacterium]|nr:TIGR03087 family PEP-CTERM/XrtA system glycosyltransferase [Planctomycetota bacterium]
MNILHLSHRIPYPPNKGDKVRSFHQIEYLGTRHDVWSAFFVDDPADWQHVTVLRKWCRDVVAIPLGRKRATVRGLARLALGGTLSEGFYRDARMIRALRRWSEIVHFDAALIYSSSMAPYERYIQARRKVMDFADWDSAKWATYAKRCSGPKAWIWGVEARRLRHHEIEWLHRFDAGIVVTEAEAKQVPTNGDRVKAKLHVVGNGVIPGDEPVCRCDGAPPRIGFVGQMDYLPNVDAVCWFAAEVFPKIRQREPGTVFQIVGRAPTRQVRALSHRDGVEVIGPVEDVRPYLEGFAVSVAPLRIAQGLQNKVLEAMAAARPVVLTSLAAKGIDAVDGQHFVVADSAAAIAEAVTDNLLHRQRAAALGAAARALVKKRYSWAHEMAKLESILLNGLNGS